jgi:DNA-binding NarL/FixJ family response regulator
MPDALPSPSDVEIGVLICDDVEAMRALLGLVIRLGAGLRVVGEARDGIEAISEAKRLQPDVILLDLSMPRRTGLDALPAIKQAAPAAQVIVFSGFVASTIEAEVLAHGAARFIEKGADPEAIIAAIREVAAVRIPRLAKATG